MTNQQIETVKRSWRRLQGLNPVLLGDVFYSKLFLENPSLERMFKSDRETQAQKLIDMLDLIIRRLDNLAPLNEEIKAMTIRHVGYGVKPKHYAQVGVALLWTLKTSMGKEWTNDVAEAWTQCYQELTDTMLSIEL